MYRLSDNLKTAIAQSRKLKILMPGFIIFLNSIILLAFLSMPLSFVIYLSFVIVIVIYRCAFIYIKKTKKMLSSVSNYS